jgi:GntR family transcriptional regulator
MTKDAARLIRRLRPSPAGGGPPQPLHVRAERVLRELIGRPEYRAGRLLPDEITLAGRLGVSRGTLRAAIARLVAEGALERRAGVGTRASARPAESGISAWRSFSREMARKGVRVETFRKALRPCRAGAEAARALGIRPGTTVLRLDRVRGWDGVPVLRSRSWFHPRLGLTGGEDFSGPLYEVLAAASGARAEHAREELRAVPASAEMARLLQVPRGAPLLLRRHTVLDPSDRPIEFAEIHYASDRFSLTLDLRREGP